jgi:tetrahydromethanopterin S-methyltransferase subunit E
VYINLTTNSGRQLQIAALAPPTFNMIMSQAVNIYVTSNYHLFFNIIQLSYLSQTILLLKLFSHTMAFVHVIIALLFALALARIDPSSCQMVNGKVSCNDCTQDYDFSGLSQIHLII